MKTIIFLCWLFSICKATVFYVSPVGNNSNSGDMNSPWASPGYATRQMSGGDTLIIQNGTYILRDFGEDMLTPPSGSANHPTVIHGEAGTVLAGGNNLYALVQLEGVDHLIVENLELTHFEDEFCRDGIAAVGEPNTNLLFRNLHIHHIDEMGIDVQDVDGLLVKDCIIEYCGFGAIAGPDAGSGGGWKKVLIRNSSLSYSGHYYQNGENENPYSRPDGFGNEESPGPIQVEDCVLEHNFGDGLDCKSDSIIVKRCTIANNRCDGLKLWGNYAQVENTLIYGRGDGDSTPTPWAAVVIGTPFSGAEFNFVNCTVDDEFGKNYCMYAQYDEPQIPVQINMTNTTISSRGSRASMWFAENITHTFSHCLFWFPQNETILQHGEIDYTQANLSELGTALLYGDPQFWQTGWGSDGDYHLWRTSPAVDAGTAVNFTTDITGNPRYNGTAVDIGAYEYQQSLSVLETENKSVTTISCYPNPANPLVHILFQLDKPQRVSAVIYNIRGEVVYDFGSRNFSPGETHLVWNAQNVSAGLYFCQVNERVLKLTVVK